MPDPHRTHGCFGEQRRLGLVMCTRQVLVAVVVFFFFFTFIATAQQAPTPPAAEKSLNTSPNSTVGGSMDQVVDRAIEREHALMQMLKDRKPLIETYLQDMHVEPEIGPVPADDHYFLGRMDLGDTLDRRDFLPKAGFEKRLLGGFTNLYKLEYKPIGFSWMIYADRDDFNRKTYNFQFAHREFLGDVRCLVFDVTPKKGTGAGRFKGRIWVEDQDYNIVRLNGIYGPGSATSSFFHFDSWRLNLLPGYWVPSYIYSEEGEFSDVHKEFNSKTKLTFKAQTRVWGYDLQKAARDSELTEIIADSTVKDATPSQDASPLEAQRAWMKLAENNILERLQKAGLLAPAGEVDKVLETVVNNLLVSNHIELQQPVRTRVMLTLPLETFSAGNTIVVSRGLLDVLPDEASLAMVLSHELAHIVLGQNQETRFAFSDRLLFSDESTYRNLGFRHSPKEEEAADQKAMDLLKNSPYSQKLQTAALFLREVEQRGHALSALSTPHLGASLTDGKGRVTRMPALMTLAPALQPNALNQIAALPLGSRVKVNPWDGRAELIKATPLAFNTARDKMPLEVTPFSPRLTRYGEVTSSAVTPEPAPPTN
jgi:hypothetical protein